MKRVVLRHAAAALAAALVLAALPVAALADSEPAAPTTAQIEPAPPAQTPEPSPTPEPAPTPAPIAPGVLIARSEMQDLPAGQQTEITVSFQNLGDTPLRKPVAAFTPSDGIVLVGGASSFLLEDIPAGGTGTVRIKLQAADNATGSQSLAVELRYGWGEETAPQSGTASDRLTIPVAARPAAAPPLVLIGRSEISSPISPNEVFNLAVTFQNTGSVAVTGAAATISPSEGLSLLNPSSTFPVPDIAPGKTGSITVRLQGAKEITSAAQSLSVDLRYTYDSAGTPTAGTAGDKVNIPAKAAAAASSSDAPVPNLVVNKFDYGGKPVQAGGDFPLSFTFENTGTTRVENIVATVDGGECFTVSGGTNTAHYKELAPGKTQTQQLPMQAVPACKSGAQGITVSFKYEYVDGGKRTPVTADIRLSVPVSQPDRFQINAPVSASAPQAGSESEITLSYVNKGRADVGNLEASLVGEGFESPASVQYLGNVAAGASGNIGFAFTPEQAGELKLTVKISYEDSNLQTQTKEFPLTLQVEESMPDFDFAEEEPAQPAGPPAWLPAIPVVLAVAAAAVVLVLRLRKRKAEEALPGENWTWQDDSGGEG